VIPGFRASLSRYGRLRMGLNLIPMFAQRAIILSR
jgi:hypothetical protein